LAQHADRFRVLAEREQRARLQLEQVEKEREAERQRREETQQALAVARRTEALARLSGGIAHDFNNALTVVFALADLLRSQSCSPQEVERTAGEILAAAESAAELTRQLLTLGRQQVWKPRAVELASFLSRFLRALRRVLPSDVTLDMTEPAKDIVALVDPAQLERACFNLALNARDAMPNGGRLAFECVKATVEERVGLAPGDYVMLSVSDDGEGMSTDVRERIFEPFFSTKESGVGSGLGLATVYAFMREAGGDVSVSSTPGRGTTFTLYLPAHTGGEASEGVHDLQGLKPAAPPGNRVLVVEDRDDVRKSMVKVLASNGFEVASASDGDAAIRTLESELPFTVMCIDGVMPGTPTARVVEQAKRAWPSLRVLLCSGYVGDDLLRRGIAVGQISFLAKPFTPQALVTSVRGLIGNDPES
jgi:signal transduction histidine kinase/CheY-like chemotaxis protein